MRPYPLAFLLVYALLYGLPHAASAEELINLSSGYCLGSTGQQSAIGALVVISECHAHPNQTWTVEKVRASSYRLTSSGSQYCLEPYDLGANAAVVVRTCTYHPNQLWSIEQLPADRYRLRNEATRLCLDTDGEKASYRPARMWECKVHPNQTWLMPNRTISRIQKLANLASTYCLDTDGRAVNGASVRMWSCQSHPNQSWAVEQVDPTSYRLKNVASHFCLDTDGSKIDGGLVRMWGCMNHPNQLWEIQALPRQQYRLRNLASGLCLDTDAQRIDGAVVRMWECMSHANQTWARTTRPEALVELPLVVIKLADDDGNRDASGVMSDATIRALVDDANAIFVPDVGIRFVLQQITSHKNTKMNRLMADNIPNCGDAEKKYPNPNPQFPDALLSASQLAAYQYAAQYYPNQIVVYINRDMYDQTCAVREADGKGFSDSALNFVRLGSWLVPGTGQLLANGQLGVLHDGKRWEAPHGYLAHELGHYFGLAHSMSGLWPPEAWVASMQLDSFCWQQKALNSTSSLTPDLADLIWDGDGLPDTPGDPGVDLYNRVVFNIRSTDANGIQNECLGRGEFEVTSNVCKSIGALATDAFVIRPARANLMSYTSQCPYLPGNTTGEVRARLTPQQVDVILYSLDSNRHRLVVH